MSSAHILISQLTLHEIGLVSAISLVTFAWFIFWMWWGDWTGRLGLALLIAIGIPLMVGSCFLLVY